MAHPHASGPVRGWGARATSGTCRTIPANSPSSRRSRPYPYFAGAGLMSRSGGSLSGSRQFPSRSRGYSMAGCSAHPSVLAHSASRPLRFSTRSTHRPRGRWSLTSTRSVPISIGPWPQSKARRLSEDERPWTRGALSNGFWFLHQLTPALPDLLPEKDPPPSGRNPVRWL